MPHETALIATIAAGLGLAFLLGLAAQRFRLPPILGYLVAGVVVGPFTPGYVADQGLASQLAEIGVILLMFGVGLHFSFGDLAAVRRIAVPGALAQIAGATVLGALLARLWGWSWGTGIVFGLALSVASTVVLLRALEDRGLLDTGDGRIAVGWLVVEDLVTVLALVLLPTLAGALGGTAPPAAGDVTAGGTAGAIALALGRTVLAVGAFVALMLVVGRRTIPWLLGRVARTGSRELFTLAVLALALGIAVGAAALFGVSFALGAFFAGVIVSESDFAQEAAEQALPLQDAFAVLFFVSVGMLFDPRILVERPLPVLGTLAIVVVGKSVVALALVLAFRRPARTALVISASLAQIGEFSFILVALGLSLGLLPREVQSLVVAGALLSITLNPLVFAAAERLARRAERRAGVHAAGAAAPAVRGVAEGMPALRGHVIVVGHGRVGAPVAAALAAENIPHVVVDHDRERVDALRAAGRTALLGDASRAEILAAAGVAHARLVVVAAPEAPQVRAIVARVRDMGVPATVLARTHGEAEREHLEAAGATLALVAEQELAMSLARAAISRWRDDGGDAHSGAPRRERRTA